MARKQRKPAGQGSAPPPQTGNWAPLRDAIRRDVEQALSALAFAERLHHKLDTQRRAFLDFPRIMEQLRSGALERLTASLSRLYEGGQGFDLQRFLRDLPLALAQLAAADRAKTQPPPPAAEKKTQEAAPEDKAQEPEASASPAEAPAESAPSPRLELRAKLLAAAPQLAKAAQSYRRNVATLRRAAQPRRSPGPWRADREVLEEARRAVDFVQKLYDTYAEAWADQPLPANLYEQTAAETDRFLAWTQLDRYVELAVLASTNAARPPKPGQQVITAHAKEPSAEQPVTEGSPGAGGTVPSEGGQSAAAESEDAEPSPASADAQPVAEPEPGRA